MILNANKEACNGEVSCPLAEDIVIKTRKYNQKIPVKTTILAAFGCAASVDVSLNILLITLSKEKCQS